MMKLYIRNVWVIKFLSICFDPILSLRSETHSSVKNSNFLKEERHIYKTLPYIFYFLPHHFVMVFQSLVIILPRFFTLKKYHNYYYSSPWGKITKFEARTLANFGQKSFFRVYHYNLVQQKEDLSKHIC